MQKFSAIALLGASQAVTPGPALLTAYPKFNTVVPAVSTTEEVGGTIKAIYSQQKTTTLTGTVGVTRGYRNDYFVAPTQNQSAAVQINGATAAVSGAIVTQSTVSRTFYPTSATLLGAYMEEVSTGAIGVIAAANGAKYGVCVAMLLPINCSAVVTVTGAGGGSTYAAKAIKGRIVAKVSATKQSELVTVLDATPLFHLTYFTWNSDFFMAAMYQSQHLVPGTAGTDGTTWCSTMDAKMMKDGTTAEVLDIAYGFTGRTKCSWQVTAEDGTVGHTFSVTQAQTLTSNVFWAEWYGSAALGTNAALPTTQDLDFWIGAYAATTNGAIYLNPVKEITSLPTASTAYTATVVPGVVAALAYLPVVAKTDPSTYVAGTIGTLMYFPGAAGDYQETQVSTIDQMQVMSLYNMYSSQVSSYNTANNSYETLRKTYDEALTKETARLADALKAAFDPKIAVPTRPCSPTRPDEYSGTYLDLSSTTAYGATYTLMKMRANIMSTISTGNAKNNLANAEASVKQGSMYLYGAVAATTLGTSVGHVFGRLGQGDATVEMGSNPFLWTAVVTATKAGMLLGFYPTTDGDVGLVSGEVVTISFKAKTWTSLSSFNKPGQPGAPTEPKKAGASMLALGATSALVLATLA